MRRFPWKVVLILYVFLLLLPGDFTPFKTGLDPSWRIGLNLVAGNQYRLGTDYVFTYGPLGYFLYPLAHGNNLAYAFLFDTLLALGVCFLLFSLIRRESVSTAILLVLFYSLSLALHLWKEYNILVLAILLLAKLEPESPHESAWLAAYGLLVSVATFMKFSVGLTALVMLLVFSLANSSRTILRKRLFVAMSAFAGSFLVLSLIYFTSLSDLPHWLSGSYLLARDYAVAMSVVGPTEVLIAGVVGLAVIARALEQQGRVRLDIALAIGLAVLLSFKHGFSRQDRHVLAYFPFLIASGAILIPLARTRKARAFATASCAALVLCSLPAAYYYTGIGPRQMVQTLSGAAGFGRLGSMVSFRQTMEDLRERSATNLKPSRLPESYTRVLKASPGRVAIMPWEISYVSANDLSWQPLPVMQTYMAYTADLDERVASFLRSDSRPEFILVDFEDIDGRNLAWTNPQTFNTLLESYECTVPRAPDQPLLLQKSSHQDLPSWVEFGRETSRSGSWIDVPSEPSRVRAAIDMQMSLPGRIMSAALRIPPVHVEIVLDDGTERSMRFVPSTAIGAPLMSSYVVDTSELEDLFFGREGPRVAKFRILGDGCVYYHDAISVTWLTTR